MSRVEGRLDDAVILGGANVCTSCVCWICVPQSKKKSVRTWLESFQRIDDETLVPYCRSEWDTHIQVAFVIEKDVGIYNGPTRNLTMHGSQRTVQLSVPIPRFAIETSPRDQEKLQSSHQHVV